MKWTFITLKETSMSQLHTQDFLETDWVPEKENVKTIVQYLIIKDLKQSWQILRKNIPLDSNKNSTPGIHPLKMLCLEEALYRQHTCPLWKKRCGPFSRKRGYSRDVERVGTIIERTVKTENREREKKILEPWLKVV